MSIDDTPSPEEEGQWGDMGLQARGGVQQWYGWVRPRDVLCTPITLGLHPDGIPCQKKDNCIFETITRDVCTCNIYIVDACYCCVL